MKMRIALSEVTREYWHRFCESQSMPVEGLSEIELYCPATAFPVILFGVFIFLKIS